MSNIFHPDFRAELKDTNYPFVPSASLSNGKTTLPRSAFIDAHIYPLTQSGRFYISSVEVESNSFLIFVGTLQNPRMLVADVGKETPGQVYSLKTSFGVSAGVILLDAENYLSLKSIADGIYNFDIRQTEFCVNCIVPTTNSGVSSIVIENDSITGDVWFLGEKGVVFQVNNSNPASPTITINLVGNPLFLQELCEEEYQPRVPLKKINFVAGQTAVKMSPQLGDINVFVNDYLTDSPSLRLFAEKNQVDFVLFGDRSAQT